MSLTPEELAFLEHDTRCADCHHLGIFHPDYDGYCGCIFPECACIEFQHPQEPPHLRGPREGSAPIPKFIHLEMEAKVAQAKVATLEARCVRLVDALQRICEDASTPETQHIYRRAETALNTALRGPTEGTP